MSNTPTNAQIEPGYKHAYVWFICDVIETAKTIVTNYCNPIVLLLEF